ncbi:MAG: hypothetical protein ON057_001712 [Glomeribacter sp. 1016415]|nr:hypothetical protein [Glomeribacter sp. 1016415]
MLLEAVLTYILVVANRKLILRQKFSLQIYSHFFFYSFFSGREICRSSVQAENNYSLIAKENTSGFVNGIS